MRRSFVLHVELEVSLGSNALLVLPVHVLAWSPLLSADLPATLPIALDARLPASLPATLDTQPQTTHTK